MLTRCKNSEKNSSRQRFIIELTHAQESCTINLPKFLVQVPATRLLNVCHLYNTRSSAVAVIADRTACKFAVRTPLHVHCRRHSAVSAHASESSVAPNGTVPTHSRRKKRCNCVAVLGRKLASFFVVHFVAKRYILEQKCQKGQIGTLMLGTRWYNF